MTITTITTLTTLTTAIAHYGYMGATFLYGFVAAMSLRTLQQLVFKGTLRRAYRYVKRHVCRFRFSRRIPYLNGTVVRTIVFPLQDNEGRGMRPTIDCILQSILKECHGYSSRDIEGTWVNEHGQVFVDRSTEVSVLIEHAYVDQWIVGMCPLWAQYLGQECLLTYASTVDARFIAPTVPGAMNRTQPLEVKA